MPISKEAELFEQANLEDVGPQPELSPRVRRLSLKEEEQKIAEIGQFVRSLDDEKVQDSDITHSGASIDRQKMVEYDEDEDVQALDIDGLSNAKSIPSSASESFEAQHSILGHNTIVTPQPELIFSFDHYQGLKSEVQDWFFQRDIANLGKIQKIFSQFMLEIGINQSFKSLRKTEKIRVVEHLKSYLARNYSVLRPLICISYLSMGHYGDITCTSNQLEHIRYINTVIFSPKNNIIELIAGLIKKKIKFLLEQAIIERTNAAQISIASHELYYSFTILYLHLSVILDSQDRNLKVTLSEIIYKTRLLQFLVQYLDKWKWLCNENDERAESSNKLVHIKQSLQIRNYVMVINKLLLVEFGTMEEYRLIKEFLKLKHENTIQVQDSKNRSITPLEYYHYSKEFIHRYALYQPLEEHYLPEVVQATIDVQESVLSRSSSNHSISSLLVTDFLESKTRSVSSSNQVPEVHIVTPAPSPKLAPQHDNMLGKKDRRMFTANPSFPNVYPYTDVPYSIKQADTIFHNHIKEGFHFKQFMSSFDQYIKKENRLNAEHPQDPVREELPNSFLYNDEDKMKYPTYIHQIEVLQRIESFYKECLPSLSSLVSVYCQILDSNIYRKRHIDGSSVNTLRKLSIWKAKEITLKSISSTVFLLLKFLKASHVLKFEYLSMLLFDNDFHSYFIDYLGIDLEQCQIRKGSDSVDSSTIYDFSFLVNCEYGKLDCQQEHSFYLKCLSLSDTVNQDLVTTEHSENIASMDNPSNRKPGPFDTDFDFLLDLPAHRIDRRKFKVINERYTLIIANLLKTRYLVISKDKMQRMYKLLDEKNTEIMRFYLSFYNINLYKPILKIIKTLTPYNGKKWKSNNMDLISYVYLYYKIQLRDSWLNPINLSILTPEERYNASVGQEYALRALIQFYNSEHYSADLSHMG
ncbi:Cell cycle arrest in response to pheromone recovery protein [Komagataella phaffii CBS 7435]|uniref:Protein involved in G1 cell cycle arrest in response to pheromon n=2 Tax=Komagataella phaffii TaxID=460519 RepID=C4R228_KOMPG|nr:Protein involved in G1 cell cycle arrest in response to pheromone [Komagataella phaffii GS115]AOA62279.1 GQ67_00972T0 [Komagataella phaffii]CAH2447901.1 Cell cycle arrest in response to pheromone recovery protein [Komagataella phaffii CBS 7435]AOA67088.1 GQ68_00417T0 [Komagataella phaffii GS115]CAY69552.1 Protein involved in G1 cell cycle arrest in response to pheromon [Komagataella phaffii GS115]SCV12006.1 Cell cycle arrest in response to pheromone recovery protein [Komagataella phaffii CB